MDSSHQYCCFFLDSLLFGVEVSRVQEVLRPLAMTPIPLAPPLVRGMVNLRGEIVTAIDLRIRLALPVDPTRSCMNVVLRSGEDRVSLLVDEIHGVVQVDPQSFQEIPETLDPAIRELLSGVSRLNKHLLLTLDVDRVLAPMTQRAEPQGHGWA